MHWFFPWHVMPQPPQFAGSIAVFTQALPHSAYPAEHAVPQPLLVQMGVPLAIAGHTFPQAPQFLISLLASTH
jgi:hypothetical protein